MHTRVLRNGVKRLHRCTYLPPPPLGARRSKALRAAPPAAGEQSQPGPGDKHSALPAPEGNPLVVIPVMQGAGHELASTAPSQRNTPHQHHRRDDKQQQTEEQQQQQQGLAPKELQQQLQRQEYGGTAHLGGPTQKQHRGEGDVNEGSLSRGVPHPQKVPEWHAVSLNSESARPARWTAVLHVPAAVWGVTWLLTSGLISAGYAALAAASCIAAAAFYTLAPGPAAATAAAAVTAARGPAAAAAASVAAVDWVDVALRTAAGLAGVVGGREQVVAALQDAGTGPGVTWAVQAVLPALCGLAGACRSAALGVQAGVPWLGALAQLSVAAAGVGVLLVMVMPLRRYLVSLLPFLPRNRPSAATLTALRAGGIACMVAVLTGLQAHELAAPALAPGVRGAAAAAAAASPLQPQHKALLYGAAAVAGDVIMAACTAVVAAWAAWWLLRREQGLDVVSGGWPDTAEVPPVVAVSAPAAGLPATVLGGLRWLAAGRLLLDALLLLAVCAGQLKGKISAVKLLGMLWLLQTAHQL